MWGGGSSLQEQCPEQTISTRLPCSVQPASLLPRRRPLTFPTGDAGDPPAPHPPQGHHGTARLESFVQATPPEHGSLKGNPVTVEEDAHGALGGDVILPIEGLDEGISHGPLVEGLGEFESHVDPVAAIAEGIGLVELGGEAEIRLWP